MEQYFQVKDIDTNNTNDIVLEPHGLHLKIADRFSLTLKKSLKLYKEFNKVCLYAEGKAVTLLVNICEELKAKYRNIYQQNEIGARTYRDLWIPKSNGIELDNLEVIRKVPTLRILLSKGKLETSCSFKREDQMNREMTELLKKEVKMIKDKKRTSKTTKQLTST